MVARQFAAEGAEVFLSGRSRLGVEEVAQHIAAAGGVVCVRTAATPETRTIQELRATMTAAMNIPNEQVTMWLADMTLLKVSPTIDDLARATAFVASDHARMMTGTVLNASAGAAQD